MIRFLAPFAVTLCGLRGGGEQKHGIIIIKRSFPQRTGSAKKRHLDGMENTLGSLLGSMLAPRREKDFARTKAMETIFQVLRQFTRNKEKKDKDKPRDAEINAFIICLQHFRFFSAIRWHAFYVDFSHKRDDLGSRFGPRKRSFLGAVFMRVLGTVFFAFLVGFGYHWGADSRPQNGIFAKQRFLENRCFVNTKPSLLRSREAQNGDGDGRKGDVETSAFRERVFSDFGSIWVSFWEA